MEISALKRDSKAVEAGQWVGDIPGLEEVRLRVRGMSSPIVTALRSRKERKVSRAGREKDGSLKHDIGLRILREVFLEAVLLDWDGFTEGGKPVPYSPDVAKAWLDDPDLIPFADAIAYAASVVDRGMAETQEDLVGKSKRSSGDNSQATT